MNVNTVRNTESETLQPTPAVSCRTAHLGTESHTKANAKHAQNTEKRVGGPVLGHNAAAELESWKMEPVALAASSRHGIRTIHGNAVNHLVAQVKGLIDLPTVLVALLVTYKLQRTRPDANNKGAGEHNI